MTANGADTGRGLVGSNRYQASTPRPPDVTRTPAWGWSLPPGPDRGCGGCVAAACACGTATSNATTASAAAADDLEQRRSGARDTFDSSMPLLALRVRAYSTVLWRGVNPTRLRRLSRVRRADPPRRLLLASRRAAARALRPRPRRRQGGAAGAVDERLLRARRLPRTRARLRHRRRRSRGRLTRGVLRLLRRPGRLRGRG